MFNASNISIPKSYHYHGHTHFSKNSTLIKDVFLWTIKNYVMHFLFYLDDIESNISKKSDFSVFMMLAYVLRNHNNHIYFAIESNFALTHELMIWILASYFYGFLNIYILYSIFDFFLFWTMNLECFSNQQQ